MIPTIWTPKVKITNWAGYSTREIPTAFRALADYLEAGGVMVDVVSIDYRAEGNGWCVRLTEVAA
jgi:hypothetical protein